MTLPLPRLPIPVSPTRDAVLARLASLPQTRFMGSKYRLLPFIHDALAPLRFETVLDACSGSAAVAYLLKAMGKQVVANDNLHFCFHAANACVANSRRRLGDDEVEALTSPNPRAGTFVQRTFEGLYFSAEDNAFLDSLLASVAAMRDGPARSLVLAAACRACVKRRPRGVFTYVGDRYQDGRRDLRLSLPEHFREAVAALGAAVFDSGVPCAARRGDVLDAPTAFDLVYLDPPYVSPSSDNDYTRRYHFLEGFVRAWAGVEIQPRTRTKKFRPAPTPFRNRYEVADGFDRVFRRFADSIIVVSYVSTGIPCRDELARMLRRYKRRVEIVERAHSFSFGTHAHRRGNPANHVREYLFVAE